MATAFLNYLDLTTYANAAALAAASTTSLANGSYAEVTDLGVFQLNKDSTASVDNATVISALNGGRWLVNYNVHIQENDHAEIDGSQIGSFSSVSVQDGSAAAPTITFATDEDTGLYLAAANTIGFAGNGLVMETMSPTAHVVATGIQYSLPVGSAAAPSYTFTGDLDTGLYHVAANTLGLATNGALAVSLSATALITASAIQISADVGSAAAPAYSFTGDLDTGLYHVGANSVGVAVNGAVAATVNATALILATGVQVSADAATAAAPAYTFTGDLDTGMYHVGANSLGFATNGLIACNISTTQLNMATGFALAIATVQVVGARQTGWTTSTGTATKNQGAIDADTITATDGNVQLVAKWLKGVTDALITHGLIGA